MGGGAGGQGTGRIVEDIAGRFLVQCDEERMAVVLFAGSFILLI